VVSALLEHPGERRHGCAADADEMNVFGVAHSFAKNQFTTKDTKVHEGNHPLTADSNIFKVTW
jgi:hypothetical protein